MKYESAPRKSPPALDTLIPPLGDPAWDINRPTMDERLEFARHSLLFALQYLQLSVYYDEARVRNTEQAKRIQRAKSSVEDALHAIG